MCVNEYNSKDSFTTEWYISNENDCDIEGDILLGECSNSK